MALTEQEELELLELEALEAGTAGATPTNAADQIKAKHAQNVRAGAAAYKPSWTESFETGYKQGGSAAAGLSNVVGEGLKGVGDAFVGAPETLRGMYQGVKQMGSELIDPAAYKGIAENPIVDLPGKIGAGLITGATEPLISPRTTGKALTEAAAPAAIGKAAAVGIRAAGPAAAAGARRIVSSIVKPSLKDQAFTKDPTGAVLKHRIIGNSLEDFSDNVQKVLDDLDSTVQTNVGASKSQIPKSEVAGLLDQEAARVTNQIGNTNKTGVLSAIQQIKEGIGNRYGDFLSVPEIHALRREIDSGITKFTQDAVEQGVNKSKYEFRSGLNNIIEREVPGTKALNHDVASLLSAKEALGRRLVQGQNAPILGGPLDIAAEVAGSLHGAPGAYTVGRKVLGSTAVKSRAAQALESMAGRPSAAGEILKKKKGAPAQVAPVAPPPVAPPPAEPVRGSYFEQNPSPLQSEVLEASRAQAAQGPQRIFNEASRVTVADIEAILKENEILRARLQGGQ